MPMTMYGATGGAGGADGDAPTRAYRSGFYYAPSFANGANAAILQDTLSAIPYYVAYATTFNQIGVIGGVAVGSNARMGIYADSSGVPGPLVLDAGSVSAAAGGLITIAISKLLTPGWYWLACVSQGAAGNLQQGQAFAGVNVSVLGLPVANPISTGAIMGYTRAGVSGALPDPFGAVTDALNAVIVYLRTA